MNDRLVIVGGGASGIICAINTKMKNPEMEVIVLEQNDRICKKILKTGNGKCNLANRTIQADKYNDFRLLKNNVTKFDCEKFFKSLGLLIKEDSDGRLYPYSESAATVVDVLKLAVEKYQIIVYCNTQVNKIQKSEDDFIIKTNKQTFTSDYLVIATGSCAQERTNGYQILQGLNHHITELTPALTYLKVKEKVNHLQGIRLKCQENTTKIAGEILFKEQGISGILTLDISRLVDDDSKISFNLIKDREEDVSKLLNNFDKEQALKGILPKMVAQDVYNRSDKTTAGIMMVLTHYSFTVTNPHDFQVAQITKGGINLDEVFDDFSSKLVKNLYIIGEVLDVDGASGGYNLYFAWMSGFIASNHITN